MFDIIKCERLGVLLNKQQINKINNIQTNKTQTRHPGVLYNIRIQSRTSAQQSIFITV